MESKDKISLASVVVSVVGVVASSTAAIMATNAKNTVDSVRSELSKVELRAQLLSAATEHLEQLDPQNPTFFEKCRIVSAYAQFEAQLLGTDQVPVIAPLQFAFLGMDENDPVVTICNTRSADVVSATVTIEEPVVETEAAASEDNQPTALLTNPVVVLASYRPSNCPIAFETKDRIADLLNDVGVSGSFEIALSTSNHYAVAFSPINTEEIRQFLSEAQRIGSNSADPTISAMRGAYLANTEGWQHLLSVNEC
ncbi:hypothetical protein [Ruegeria arenilitoris]|uniref:hypothetical protein n=1 Tax=Ruegeria arenilitoris TaxID=1173585 RepID=UPI0014813741|nr:hypothetical protein [Ruegeria arenilitoris]